MIKDLLASGVALYRIATQAREDRLWQTERITIGDQVLQPIREVIRHRVGEAIREGHAAYMNPDGRIVIRHSTADKKEGERPLTDIEQEHLHKHGTLPPIRRIKPFTISTYPEVPKGFMAREDYDNLSSIDPGAHETVSTAGARIEEGQWVFLDEKTGFILPEHMITRDVPDAMRGVATHRAAKGQLVKMRRWDKPKPEHYVECSVCHHRHRSLDSAGERCTQWHGPLGSPGSFGSGTQCGGVMVERPYDPIYGYGWPGKPIKEAR